MLLGSRGILEILVIPDILILNICPANWLVDWKFNKYLNLKRAISIDKINPTKHFSLHDNPILVRDMCDTIWLLDWEYTNIWNWRVMAVLYS